MIVDTRGKSCPEPVILTKEALEKCSDDKIIIYTDSEVSKENIIRYLNSEGVKSEVQEKDNYFVITVVTGKTSTVTTKVSEKIKKGLIYYISSDAAGGGDCELGQKLIVNMISTIEKLDFLPENMFFLNTGTYLTTLNEKTIESLKKLADRGVRIFTCGTCLKYFKLEDCLKVGEITDTFSLLTALSHANNIIKL
jgi:selenium metabolism protein YedF